MADIKYAVLQRKIEGIVYDMMPQTRAINVLLDDGRTTLTAHLATLATDAILSEEIENVKGYIDQKINDLINGAPEILDTFKEVADWIESHHGEYEALVGVVQELADGKVDKKSGYDLSKNDLTDALLAKLNGIEENANRYVHPDSHSADIIDETTNRKFLTPDERTKISESGRILIGVETPVSLQETDLFMKII